MLKIAAILVGSLAVIWYIVVPVFERLAPPEMVRAYQRLTMPFFRSVAGFAPGFGIVETIGRRTGKRHQVPVGGRLIDGSFWFVSGIGRRTHYVRNIEANPRVRVKIGGRWHPGTARLCPEDDGRKRAVRVSPMNGVFLLIANSDPLSIRVDIDR